ncbi:MAG: NAD-dependent epimerase/dehydratase family protein [Pseudolabrys sp.]
MKVFVSGGAGQIGSHVVEMLLERGDRVVAIDNYATGRPEHLPKHQNFTFIEGSIADKPLVDQSIGDFAPDVLIHTAASYKDPDDWYSDTMANAVGGANLIKAAKANKVGRFIYFQTALCYGVKPLQNPIPLDHPKNQANSSYAISKTVTEDYLTISGLDYVTFRLANVIGPRNVSGPLPIFFQRLTEGKKCFVTNARRDFVFVKDLARTVIKAADGKGRGPYHFSSGGDIAIRTLYDAIVKAMRLNEYPEPEVREISPDDAPTILLDPTHTFEDFGEIKFTPLDETVSSAIAYYEKFGVHGGYTHLRHDKK